MTFDLQGDGISTVSPLPPGPPEQLSGVAVVIIIAVCAPDYTTILEPACEAFFV